MMNFCFLNDGPGTAPLMSICYRSVVSADMQVNDILHIVETAQNRNAARNVTGVLFYEHGRFLQWIEGTDQSLAEVMQAIRNAKGHTSIEIISMEKIAARRYSEWHMQLSCSEADAALLSISERDHVVVLSDDLLPVGDAPLEAAQVLAIGGFLADTCRAAQEPLETLLPEVMKQPPPVARVALRAAPLRKVDRVTLEQTATALTALLVQSDPFANVAEMEALCRAYGPLPVDFGRLYEAISETVGDALKTDSLTMAQATLASAALQTVLRRIHRLPDPERARGDVTVSSAPGEQRFLEATISGEILRVDGWSTSVLYPESDAALIERLRRNGPSTLVLAGSQLDPEAGEDRMIGLIGALRTEPDLPALKIIVGGRIARMPKDQIAFIGADAAFEHILDVAEAVSRTNLAATDSGRKTLSARNAPPRDTQRRGITTGFLLANVMPHVLHRMTERRLNDG